MLCEKCKMKIQKSQDDIEREKLMNIMMTELAFSSLVTRIFNRIGNYTIRLADLYLLTNSFRITKKDTDNILMLMKKEKMIKIKNKGNEGNQVTLVKKE